MRRFYVATLLLSLGSLTVLGQTQPAQSQKQQTATQKLEKKSLATSEEDRSKYSEFLKEPNSGLIMLLPRGRYEVNAAEAPKKKTETTPTGIKSDVLRGGGAYYSFSLLTHEYNYGSDLSLERGQFRVGFAGADYGFLANLGDVPLESISLDTHEAKRLAAYARVRQEADARLEYRRFEKGTEIDGVKVKSLLPMELNSTYLVRAINYRQADVLVAFKVVKVDGDGSALILWKLLKRYSTPELARTD